MSSPRRPKARTDAAPQITSAERRRTLGESFSAQDLQQAQAYDALRPHYPDAAVSAVLGSGSVLIRALITELMRQTSGLMPWIWGAGTGILSRQLLAAGARVTAVEPSVSMTAVLAEQAGPGPLTVVNAPAEETGLAGASFDVVAAAQAWHWFDPLRAQQEAARLLTPGGRLALLWNYIDTSDETAHRLTRIMRAGDVYRPGWAPALEASLFGSAQTTELRWSRRMTVEEIVGYAKTLSSWLSADEGERERRRRNLSDYLQGELGLGDEAPVQVPMITAVHVAPVHRLQYS